MVTPHFQSSAGFGTRGAAVLNLFDNIGQLFTQEDRYNGRRRFIGPETMVIAGVGRRNSEKFGIFIHSFNNCAEEGQKLGVGMGVVPGSSRFWPSLLLIDQLLCLPEPLTRQRFLCSKQPNHDDWPLFSKYP